MVAEIEKTGAVLASTRLGNRIAFAGALAEGLSVGEVQSRGRAAAEIDALAHEILRSAEGGPKQSL